ncbi:MAG: hypothetical protein LUE27_08915 [Clostridia bacterium]|nr:hypothetical protein [Clostridia bacterium]
MNFIKKQTVSSWLTLVAFILAIVAVAMFASGNNSAVAAGLFGTFDTSDLMAESVIEIIFLAAIIALSEFKLGGIIGDIFEWVVWALKILVCILPVLALIGFLGMRVQGLANLYFSDANIQATMQTEENLAAASQAIATAIIYGVTAVVAVVAAFFRPYKKVKASAAVA